MAGTEWNRLFMKMYPKLSLRTPTATSVARVIGFNLPQCNRDFEKLLKFLHCAKQTTKSDFNKGEALRQPNIHC